MATEFQKLRVKMETNHDDTNTDPSGVSGEAQYFVSGSGTAARMYHVDGDGNKGTVLTNELISGGVSLTAAGVATLSLNAASAGAVDVGADSIAIIDADDSNATKKELISDLTTAMAGSGLEANSGVLAWYPDEVSGADVNSAADSILILDADDSNNPKKESIDDFLGAIAGAPIVNNEDGTLGFRASNNAYINGTNQAGNALVNFMKARTDDTMQISSGGIVYFGDGGAEDTAIVFDGNAQDYRIGLDDGTDKLEIGLGSAHGTTTAITVDTNLLVACQADLTVGDDLSLTSDAAVLNFGAGNDVTFTHDGGTGMDIVSAGALDISSTGAGATFTVVDGQTLTLGKSGASALLLSPHATAGSELASLTNTAGTTDGTDGAGAILMSSVAGGMSLAWADTKDLWAEGGSMMFVANEDKASCIQLHADAGSSQTIHIVNDAGTSATEGTAAVQLLASAGGVNIKSGLDGANAILLTADGGTSETIKVHADQGTTATSIELASDAGGISILAGNTTHGVKIATGTSGVPVTIGHGTSEVTVADNLTVSGNLTVTGTTVTDSVEVISTSTGVIFEGGTDDGHEATMLSAVAGADVTYTLPNLTGHVPLLAGAASNASVTAAEFALLDGGSSVGTTAVADGDGIVTNDGGTMKHTTVQTFQTYFDANSVGGTSIVTAGALNAGSITSGFGAIDNGTSGIRTATFTAETAFVPDAQDGAALGTNSLQFSDLFLADGATIAMGDDGDITLTHVPDVGLKLSTLAANNGAGAAAFGTALGGITSHVTSNSPADDDYLGGFFMNGEDDNSDEMTFASVQARIKDASNGSADGALLLGALVGDSMVQVADFGDTTASTWTFADGAYNVNIASHDGTNGLALAGTVITKTAAQINNMVATDTANTFTEDQIFGGTTPTVTIGDGGAEDTMLVFDGNATDVRIGLDDGTDKLEIGTGTAHGTTTAMTIDTSQQVAVVATTAASSTTTGALTVAGGASVAGDLYVGDDLCLASDSALLKFGADGDIIITHSPDYGLHISQDSDAASEPTLTLETVGDLANGPILDFKLDNGAGEADDDQLGQIRFYGDDSANAATLYAHIKAVSEDITDATEDGSLTFTTLGAGSEKVMVYGNGAGLVLLNDSTYGTVKAHSFVTYSDETLKTNIQPLADPLAMVKKLQGYNYDWKSDGSSDIGFIAQEVEKVIPQVVYSKEGEAGSYGLDYASLTALLTEAIKQQDNEITALKATLSTVLSSQEALLSKLGIKK